MSPVLIPTPCLDQAFNSSVTWETADFSSLPAIQDMPVNSAISLPAAKSLVQLTPEGSVEMKARAGVEALPKSIHTYMYIYIYIYVCVCVAKSLPIFSPYAPGLGLERWRPGHRACGGVRGWPHLDRGRAPETGGPIPDAHLGLVPWRPLRVDQKAVGEPTGND